MKIVFFKSMICSNDVEDVQNRYRKKHMDQIAFQQVLKTFKKAISKPQWCKQS